MTNFAFTPNQLSGYSFQPSLFDISGAGDEYTAKVSWNTFEQRWYLSITSAGDILAINTPLVESPDTMDFNLIGASSNPVFSSTIVFRDSTGMFEVNP